MAVDGRKFSDTLMLGSDEWYDFPCSPCVKDGKNVAAAKYCVECDENLCSTCLTHHNRFAIMRGHQTTDKLSSQTGQKRPDLLSQRCDKHGGKLVDLYCSPHDNVGCSACIAVDHSLNSRAFSRFQSLLPWRQKSKKHIKSDSDIKSGKESKDTNANTAPSVCSASREISTKKEAVVEVPETTEEEKPEQPKFCRVNMPDGSTSVVGTRQGLTIKYILGEFLEKRHLSIASVDVFLLGSEKPLNLDDDISILGSKEIIIERRVLFRLDLPNKKSIGVKAKPNRLIKDVLKPILNKYGYRMDAIDAQISGQADNLCLDNLVCIIDGQRVIVLNQAPDTHNKLPSE